MKLLIQTTLVGFATLCAAQLQDLPDCAKPCASSLPSSCKLNPSCICADDSWISGISCCIATKCSPSDQQKTLNVAVQFCDTVNVKLPSAASCPASASATAAVSSAVGGGNSAASAGGSTTASAVTTSAVSGAETTSSSSATGGSTTSTSATGSSSSKMASTSSSATHASTGAAQVWGSIMGAVGAAVAVLAWL